MNRSSKIQVVILMAAAVLVFWQYRQHAAQSRQLAVLTEQDARNRRELASRQSAFQEMEARHQALLHETLAKAPNETRALAQQRAAAVAAFAASRSLSEAKTNRAYARALADKLDNPAQREANRLFVRNEAKTKAGAWLKRLNLTPDQMDQIYDLCAENELSKNDRIAALLRGKVEVGAALQERDKAELDFHSRLKALLGDTGYAQYEEDNQNKLAAEAANQVSGLNQLLGANALDGPASERLRGIIRAELASTKLVGPNVDDTETFRPLDDWMRDFTGHVQHVSQQAAEFLTPEQMAVVNKAMDETTKSEREQLIVKQKLYGMGAP